VVVLAGAAGTAGVASSAALRRLIPASSEASRAEIRRAEILFRFIQFSRVKSRKRPG
jgi:hypothetical protein